MLEEESKKARLRQKVEKYFDLGFFGIGTEYHNVVMPNKKPRGKELSKNQKRRNRSISRIRVKVEHSFAGVKRLYITYNVCRIKRDDFIDLVSCNIQKA